MGRAASFVIVLSFVSLAGAQPPSALRIVDPADGSTVPYRVVVTGEVTSPVKVLWVVIRPTATGDFWVQPPVRDLEDGKWSTTVYIGRQGSLDVGAGFELRAFGDPKGAMKEGLVLRGWPEARLASPVIHVERGR